jgi:hypothetical protein
MALFLTPGPRNRTWCCLILFSWLAREPSTCRGAGSCPPWPEVWGSEGVLLNWGCREKEKWYIYSHTTSLFCPQVVIPCVILKHVCVEEERERRGREGERDGITYSLTLCCSCGRGTPRRPVLPILVAGRGREWRWDCSITPDGDGLMLERAWPAEEDNAPWGWAEVRGGKPTGATSGARPSICSFICLLSQLMTARNIEWKILLRWVRIDLK